MKYNSTSNQLPNRAWASDPVGVSDFDAPLAPVVTPENKQQRPKPTAPKRRTEAEDFRSRRNGTDATIARKKKPEMVSLSTAFVQAFKAHK